MYGLLSYMYLCTRGYTGRNSCLSHFGTMRHQPAGPALASGRRGRVFESRRLDYLVKEPEMPYSAFPVLFMLDYWGVAFFNIILNETAIIFLFISLLWGSSTLRQRHLVAAVRSCRLVSPAVSPFLSCGPLFPRVRCAVSISRSDYLGS